MNNSEIWSHYKDYTRDVTEFSRKLAFAGIAVCWVLRNATGAFSRITLFALAFIVSFFIADILQGLSGAVRLKHWIEAEEQKKWDKTGKIDGDYVKPKSLDRPSYIFFLIKIVLLLIGFALIGVKVFTQ